MLTHSLDGSDNPLPLLIEPASTSERGMDSLLGWMGERQPWLEEQLTERGALLFRGFAVDGAPAFERVARAIDGELKNDYLGTSPRDALTEYVFSASELPGYYPIPQHIEMSFVREPPRRLFFCCLLASSGEGGETPLVDFRRVYRDLDPAVRERFVSRGVTNIRNYGGPPELGGGASRFDLWKLKRWDEMFRTTDRATVEESCHKNGFELAWKPRAGLRLTNTQSAVRAHPKTGEPVWFNHSQVFHLSAVPSEYRRIARRFRQGGLRYRLLGEFARAMVALKSALTSTEDQAMHCTYGDGSPIPDADMEKVRDAIWKNMVAFQWRGGDVVAIDNNAVSHGRMPYSGPRKIAVCWA